MAKERVFMFRNTGTEEAPVWEPWFMKTVADAVMMSDADGEEKNIVDYVNQKIADLIGSAPETYDTLQEIAEYIASHKDVSDALTAAIGNKVDKVEGKDLSTNDYTNEDKSKLDGIENGANNYQHPDSHPASMVTQDDTHRFVSDTEKQSWNAKANVYFGSDLPASAPAGSLCFLIS